MKFHIMIYGCQMNYADSARLKAILTNIGWQYTDDIDSADVVIFDTCSIKQKSEDKVSGIIKDISPDKKIWITGCMIQHDLDIGKYFYMKGSKFVKGNFNQNIITNQPNVIGIDKPSGDRILLEDKNKLNDYVFVNHAYVPIFSGLRKKHKNLELLFRIDDVAFLPLMLSKLGYKIDSAVDKYSNYTNILPSDSNQNFSQTQKTAFVPIQTGCSQFCSYCIVPFARGFEKNHPVNEIISEIKYHVDNGKQEIVLLGQIVNKHKDFELILRQALKIEGLKWLRYTSPYPTYYTDEIFALHESEPKLCPQIHIPVQSGSDTILKKMNRGYTSDQFKTFVDKIRLLSRPISITTDIIVGFCDETDNDFQQTLDITRYSRFDMIYIGIYSPRPLTLAYKKYQDNVPKEVKQQRWKALTDLLLQISLENNKPEIGQTKEVLITKNDNGILTGYDASLKNVYIPDGGDVLPGDFYQVQIVDAQSLRLIGSIKNPSL